jgi:hypothetical protein
MRTKWKRHEARKIVGNLARPNSRRVIYFDELTQLPNRPQPQHSHGTDSTVHAMGDLFERSAAQIPQLDVMRLLSGESVTQKGIAQRNKRGGGRAVYKKTA